MAATIRSSSAIAIFCVMATTSLILSGCSRSTEGNADALRGQASSGEGSTALGEDRLPELLATGSQVVPTGLTETPLLPRREVASTPCREMPSGYIASEVGAATDSSASEVGAAAATGEEEKKPDGYAFAENPLAGTPDLWRPITPRSNGTGDAANRGTELNPPSERSGNVAPAVEPVRPGAAASRAAVALSAASGESNGTTRSRVMQGSEPFDPIKVNGPIFTDWGKPKLAMVITGMEHGYIEPCGCAGLDRMKGGMSRRHSLFKQLREDGWPVIGLDVGGIANGRGLQAVLKFHRMVEGKRQMGYDAIGLGADDLLLPPEELLAATAEAPGQPSPFVSANVGLFELGAGMPAATRIIERGGVKVGVTAILGDTYRKSLRDRDIKTSDAAEALRKVLPELKKTDYRVLLANATLQESIALAKAFPMFNVVVTSDSPPEPPKDPQIVEGTKTLLIEVGSKGMDAIVLGLFDDAQKPWRYQRVPLDSRFPQSPEMKLIMGAYQDSVKEMGFAGLGIRAVPHPQAGDNGRFVGSKKCESCHDIANSVWKKSGHSRAYDALARLDPPRNFDPECLSCHVIGWHPTKFFPYEGGYTSKEETPQLTDTGCEDCHGPGEKHVAAELGGTEAERQTLRKRMVVTKAEAEKQQCISCHDGDNSPSFDFKKYWPFVEHKEKE